MECHISYWFSGDIDVYIIAVLLRMLSGYYYYYYYYYYHHHHLLVFHLSALVGKYSPILGCSNQQD